MKITIVTRHQAPYYKALYTSLGKRMLSKGDEINIILWDQAQLTHKFEHEVAISSLKGMDVFETKAWLIPKLGPIALLRIWRKLRKLNPDVILMSEYAVFNISAYCYSRLFRKKLIVSTELGLRNIDHYPSYVKWVRKLFGKVNGVVAHAPAAMLPDLNVIDNDDNSKVVRAYHAEDVTQIKEREYNSVIETVKMVYLASLIPRKGIDLLFKILRRAATEGIKYQLDVIGVGDLEWAKDQAEQNGVSENITFLGYLQGEDLDAVLRRNEIFVLPSRFDTYGAVTHEAASRGLALFVSKNAGSHVMVDSGINGWVFDPEEIEKSAQLLTHFLDVSNRKNMMKASRKIALDYCATKNAERVANLLWEISK